MVTPEAFSRGMFNLSSTVVHLNLIALKEKNPKKKEGYCVQLAYRIGNIKNFNFFVIDACLKKDALRKSSIPKKKKASQYFLKKNVFKLSTR